MQGPIYVINMLKAAATRLGFPLLEYCLLSDFILKTDALFS